jgi:3-oxoacyl-[acyl-carrier protein] reductase
MMDAQLVIVTGATKGVGLQTAIALARDHGCTVIAVGRDEERLRTLERSTAVSNRVEALPLDIAAPGAVEKLLSHLNGRKVTGLVNNAGLLIKRTFGSWSADDMQRLFQVNMIAPVLLVQGLREHFSNDGSAHVVNISSMGGFQGSVKFPGLLAYSSSKAALANATECMAEELKPLKVSCNCLCLGAVDTEMLRAAFPDYKAPTTAEEAGTFIAHFILSGQKLLNGKVLPLSLSTP